MGDHLTAVERETSRRRDAPCLVSESRRHDWCAISKMARVRDMTEGGVTQSLADAGSEEESGDGSTHVLADEEVRVVRLKRDKARPAGCSSCT